MLRRPPHLTLRGVAYMRTNAALMRSIQWQSRARSGADASDPSAPGQLAQLGAASAGAAVVQPAAQDAPDAATAAGNRDANMEGMCAAEQVR